MSMTQPISSAPSQPTITHTLVGELTCHLCGTTAGTVESEQRTLPRTVRFTPSGSDKSVTVLDWTRLRCARCNGRLFVEGLETVRRRVEPVNVFEEDRPRRGRPPKWLVEKRRLEREALEREMSEQAA